jgi:hypothetical protein
MADGDDAFDHLRSVFPSAPSQRVTLGRSVSTVERSKTDLVSS